jgi:hypothetical protein
MKRILTLLAALLLAPVAAQHATDFAGRDTTSGCRSKSTLFREP